MTSLAGIRASIRAASDPERAVHSLRFFRTGPGEYGEGDRFLGATVPSLRKVIRAHRDLSRADTLKLLTSPWHEDRLVALLLLVHAHERGTPAAKLRVHRDYLANTEYVNNWDLVDSSAGEIVGSHIPERGTQFLERLARSASLWERRIAIVATLWTIRNDDFAPTVLIAEKLLRDEHDLIHKAVGWMLREVGKRDVRTLRVFLDAHAATMPRTALRYSIEHFDDAERKRYMRRTS